MHAETIQDYFKNWQNGKGLAKKPSTAERYGIVVKRFLSSIGPRAKHPLATLTVRDLENFRNESNAQRRRALWPFADVRSHYARRGH